MAPAGTVRAALATVEAADAAASLTELPGLLLPALVNLVGADSALWTELDVTAAVDTAAGSLPGRVIGYPEPLLTGQAALALERHARQFPLTCHTRPGGDGRPVRRSDLQSMRSFRSSGMYADVARTIGIDQMLATALTPRGLHVCVSLNRAGLDFTAAEVDLLTQLRPLLTRRVARLQAGRAVLARGTTPGSPQLTARQQQVLRLVGEGLTDAAIGRRLCCSPRTVDKHLEHIYRVLGVSCRTAAIAAAWTALMDTCLRVGEPVAYGDNALHVPDRVDDVVAHQGGLRRALDGGDAVLDRGGEPGRVAGEIAQGEILGDPALYLRVRPTVYAQHVGAGHDADQPSVVAGDREPLNVLVVHQAGRVGDRLVGSDGHGWLGHQVGRGHRIHL
jgi:DNA-binding CsgD family transcriptional regulator